MILGTICLSANTELTETKNCSKSSTLDLKWEDCAEICTDGAQAQAGKRGGLPVRVKRQKEEGNELSLTIKSSHAYLSDMFQKFYELNLQGTNIHLPQLADKIIKSHYSQENWEMWELPYKNI